VVCWGSVPMGAATTSLCRLKLERHICDSVVNILFTIWIPLSDMVKADISLPADTSVLEFGTSGLTSTVGLSSTVISFSSFFQCCVMVNELVGKLLCI